MSYVVVMFSSFLKSRSLLHLFHDFYDFNPFDDLNHLWYKMPKVFLMFPGVDQVMHLWQGCHRCDIVLFSLCPFSWHAVLKCSVTDDVHSDHLIKVMSVSHLHCEVFGRGWGTLQRRQWHPTPALLPGKSHGQKSLVGCSPWDRYKLDTTEWLHFHFPALEKEMATHSSVLAWRIPGTEEPGGLPSMGSHRVRRDWSDLAAAAAEVLWPLRNLRNFLPHQNVSFCMHLLYQYGPLASYFIPIIMSHNPLLSFIFMFSLSLIFLLSESLCKLASVSSWHDLIILCVFWHKLF